MSLVAYHSEAQFEANPRGLAKELEKIPREYSAIADTLTYCDMTTGPAGLHITFEERIDDILQHYDEMDIVAKIIRGSCPVKSSTTNSRGYNILQSQFSGFSVP